MTTARWIAWGALAAALAAGLLGLAFGWFREIAWFDEVVHACSFGAIALVLAVHLTERRVSDLPDHRWLQVAFVFSATVTLGVAWEVAEWLYDMARAPNTILGKRDTMIDLCVDALGALVGAVLGLRIAPGRAELPATHGSDTVAAT